MTSFIAITLLSFLAMEGVAYLAHRFLFHGPLWFLHRSHHLPGQSRLEWNDLFGVLFAPIAVVLMGGYLAPNWLSVTYPLGLGMTLYGCVYFFVHDIYTHRRVFKLDLPGRWLKDMRAAHRHHHSSVSHEGQEPYGFLIFQTYEKRSSRAERAASRS